MLLRFLYIVIFLFLLSILEKVFHSQRNIPAVVKWEDVVITKSKLSGKFKKCPRTKQNRRSPNPASSPTLSSNAVWAIVAAICCGMGRDVHLAQSVLQISLVLNSHWHEGSLYQHTDSVYGEAIHTVWVVDLPNTKSECAQNPLVFAIGLHNLVRPNEIWGWNSWFTFPGFFRTGKEMVLEWGKILLCSVMYIKKCAEGFVATEARLYISLNEVFIILNERWYM